MVIAFSGWMDGGGASTGTLEYLTHLLDAHAFAEMDPASFYIYNFPGSKEIISLSRPYTAIEDGLVTEFEEPECTFLCSEPHNLILFEGKEPNLAWETFADCLFSLADSFDVRHIYFIGSVTNVVPHTREPRIYSSVSAQNMYPFIARHGLIPTNYEGPASFVTYLMVEAHERNLPMATLVVELPAYIQGTNAKGIEALVRKLQEILDIQTDFGDLTRLSHEFEERLDEIVRQRPELREMVTKIENSYDQQASNAPEFELRQWFERQHFRIN